MKRRCHACGESAVEHARDERMRGGTVLEHWRCEACETRTQVLGPWTAVAAALGGLFFAGTALLSDRFSGSAESIAIMRVGLFGFGVALVWLGPIGRWRFERAFPPTTGR